MKRIKTISYDRNSSETSVDIPVKKKKSNLDFEMFIVCQVSFPNS